MHLSFQHYKRLFTLLSLIFGVVLASHAEQVEIDGLYYELNTTDRSASVTSYNNSAIPTSVVIPESVTYNSISFPVTAIEQLAFKNCTKLESISIPSSVVRVGETTSGSNNTVFYSCTSLKYVRFEDGDTNIKLGAIYANYQGIGLFYSCPLEEVYIGRNIEYINSSYSFSSSPSRYGYSAFYNQSKLAKVTIGEKVTEIPEYLFYGNSAITLMTLPNIKKIGKSAFKECSKLTTLNFGDKLESIEEQAFYNCQNITKLTLPNSTQSIGNSAFENCTSVTEITVGSGLCSIGSRSFYGCESFTAIILPDVFTTMGESAFEGCKKLTIAKLGESLTTIPRTAFKDCVSLSEMNIPASVETIDDEAFFNDSGLATITMNEGLKTIGNRVFWNNSGIMQFSIPGTVTSIGENCFYGCTRTTYLTFRDGDEELTLNNVGTVSAKITSSTYANRVYDYFCDCPIRFLTLGRNLKYTYSDRAYIYDLINGSWDRDYRASAPFVNSTELHSVTIGPKVTYLYHHLFEGCTNLSSLKLGENLKTIYTYTFKNCDTLKTVEFPESLKLIGGSAFYSCDNLDNLTFPGQLETIGAYAFYSCENLNKVIFPGRLESIGSSSFAECKSLTTSIFKSSTHGNLLSINGHAFYNCKNLLEVTFPGHLRSLGEYAYQNCTALTSTIFNNTSISDNLLEIANYAFSRCQALKTVRFPSHLYKIWDYVYEECSSLNELSFPANLVSIGNYVFRNTSFLTDVIFEDSSNAITLGSGASGKNQPLFADTNLNSLYLGRNIEYDTNSSAGYSPFYNQPYLTDVRFSQGGHVTYCKDYLLNKVSGCRALILPESLQSIGAATFAGMTELQGIIIPNKVSEIGTYAFSEDRGLKYAQLSTSCSWLKEGLFNQCDSLESITIPQVVTKMDTKLFANCKSLATATFKGSSDMINIAYGASEKDYGLFRDCPLETLNLDRWLSYDTQVASHSPFYSITTLKNINFGENVGVVDKYMFSYCTGLEELYLPDNIESVGLWGFRGCTSLKNVRFSEKLSQVSDYGFAECTSLDNVSFPASMTSVADHSFSDCTSLKKLDLGKSLLIIGPSAFKNDTALEGIEIPETLYGLGVEAFANCISLPFVAIKAITSVGRQAFEGCTGLQWVSLSAKTTSLGENSFAGCNDIKYIKSYAELPPEGLVNFVQSVPENGTLFVPENSLEYYQYSPTWENWYSIRPLNEDIMVSSVELDKTEISFKANQTAQLNATVGAEDATDKGVIWRTSNDDIAEVSSDGLVTAISVGEATITAWAADGSGIKAECKVTVDPTLVESISIDGDVATLKKGRTLELSATVLPVSATNDAVIWSSSNSSIARVDKNGIVTAVSAGNAIIKATAADNSGSESTYNIAIVPPTKGDSNDNDAVTVTDAVNTANYAVGNEVENFCFEAADINGDNRITLSDASGTITVLLDAPVAAASVATTISRASDSDADMLIADDFAANVGETANVKVRMDNIRDYVALQADVIVPDGMSVVSVNAEDRAANHTLFTKHLDANTVRVVLFDLDKASFADNNEPVFSVNVKVDKAEAGDVAINNIEASDTHANEYRLSSIGGHNSGMSGISEISYSEHSVIGGMGEICVKNAQDCTITVYTLDGSTVVRLTAKAETESISLVPGIYIVTVNNEATKVVVK